MDHPVYDCVIRINRINVYEPVTGASDDHTDWHRVLLYARQIDWSQRSIPLALIDFSTLDRFVRQFDTFLVQTRDIHLRVGIEI